MKNNLFEYIARPILLVTNYLLIIMGLSFIFGGFLIHFDFNSLSTPPAIVVGLYLSGTLISLFATLGLFASFTQSPKALTLVIFINVST